MALFCYDFFTSAHEDNFHLYSRSRAVCKRLLNPLLLQLEDRYPGVKIGSIRIPHITVADDLAILAETNKSDSQVMVWDVEDSSNRERYCVHPAKSHILWYKFRGKDDSDLDVFLGDKKKSLCG